MMDNVKAVKVDVSKEADVKNLIDTAVETFGKLDILCNNAGVIGPHGNIDEYTEEQWNQVISININGPFFGIKHAVPHIEPSELANVACFLASDEASYVTGQTYVVDGGKDTI